MAESHQIRSAKFGGDCHVQIQEQIRGRPAKPAHANTSYRSPNHLLHPEHNHQARNAGRLLRYLHSIGLNTLVPNSSHTTMPDCFIIFYFYRTHCAIHRASVDVASQAEVAGGHTFGTLISMPVGNVPSMSPCCPPTTMHWYIFPLP